MQNARRVVVVVGAFRYRDRCYVGAPWKAPQIRGPVLALGLFVFTVETPPGGLQTVWWCG